MGLEILQSNIKRPVTSRSFQASMQRRLAATLACHVQTLLTKEVKDMETPGGVFCGSRTGWPEVFHMMLVCITGRDWHPCPMWGCHECDMIWREPLLCIHGVPRRQEEENVISASRVTIWILLVPAVARSVLQARLACAASWTSFLGSWLVPRTSFSNEPWNLQTGCPTWIVELPKASLR